MPKRLKPTTGANASGTLRASIASTAMSIFVSRSMCSWVHSLRPHPPRPRAGLRGLRPLPSPLESGGPQRSEGFEHHDRYRAGAAIPRLSLGVLFGGGRDAVTFARKVRHQGIYRIPISIAHALFLSLRVSRQWHH